MALKLYLCDLIPKGSITAFGFLKIVGNTIGHNSGGNILSKTVANTGFVNKGVITGAKNNIS